MAFIAQGLHARRFKGPRVIMALILREMSTTYGRSPGGYLWALLEPIAGITLLSLVFSAAFRTPPLGTEFPLFYASGYLPFMLYVTVSLRVSACIRFSKQLLSYPCVTYFDAVMARFILATLTHLMVFIVVMSGIILIGDSNPTINLLLILNSLCMAACLGLAIGTLNCFLFGVIPVWEQIWGILNKPMFIISGVLFLFDSVPSPYDNYLIFNPLVHVVGEMRRGIFTNYQGAYVEPFYIYLLAITIFAIGLLLLNRYNRTILNN